MKHLEVAAAAIIKNGRVFCARRPDKDQNRPDRSETAGKWEFPGGKIEADETPRQTAEREVFEELGVKIRVKTQIGTAKHQYETFFLAMQVFEAELTDGTIVLSEHTDSRWLGADELYSVDWAPADLPILPLVENLLKNSAQTR